MICEIIYNDVSIRCKKFCSGIRHNSPEYMIKPIPETTVIKAIILDALLASGLIVSTLELFGLLRTFFGMSSAGFGKFVAEVVCLRTKPSFIAVELFNEFKLSN